MPEEISATVEKPGRIAAFDVIRGFSILSMMAYHFCYDLKYIVGFELDWFSGSLSFVWRASIAWTFLFLAGIMCSYSKNNLRRSFKYLAVAAAIFIVTALAGVDDPISFGIIFCMGASTFIDACFDNAGVAPKSLVASVVFLLLFYVTFRTPAGYWQFGPLTFELPRTLYDSGFFDWAGFLSPSFVSGDYYPVLPYFFMFGAGISFGRYMKGRGYPEWFRAIANRPLQFLGRHSLAIYVIHQPILLLVAMGMGSILL